MCGQHQQSEEAASSSPTPWLQDAPRASCAVLDLLSAAAAKMCAPVRAWLWLLIALHNARKAPGKMSQPLRLPLSLQAKELGELDLLAITFCATHLQGWVRACAGRWTATARSAARTARRAAWPPASR